MLQKKSLIVTFLLALAIIQVAAQEGVSSFEFIENKGQWEKEVVFKGQLPAGNFYLNKNGFTVVQHNTDDLLRFYNDHAQRYGNLTKQTGKSAKAIVSEYNATDSSSIRSHAYQMQFVGGSSNAQIIPDKMQSGYVNYLIGNDPSKWASFVKTYQAVLYKNVYPNIDVRYYSENGRLKYDIIVNPGGDVNNIAMRYAGADKLAIKNQELVIKTSVNDVKELYPYSFQFDNIKGKQEVSCSYVLEDKNTVRFKVSNYSKSQTLVIDPTLIFSSFTGSTADEWAYTATPGPDGSLYSGGIVFGSGFPVSPGAYKTTYTRGGSKGVDIGILKFSPNGSQRSYATYIGGEKDEFPHSLYCDPSGNLVILGRTYSSNYPGTREGTNYNGTCDMVVTKLNANGSALIGSMVISGSANDGLNIEDQMESSQHKTNSLLTNYGDDSHSEVILDAQGYIYVAGQTRSSDFPMRGNGFQQKWGGNQDGVVLKINPDCNTIIWSSYLGGNSDDAAFVLALRPNTQEIYVAGATSSSNFPNITPGSIKTTNNGDIDGYVAVISNDGTTQIRSTYYGTTSKDLIFGIQFDRFNYPYVLGTTRGSWSTKNVNYKVDGAKQFISKLQPDLTSEIYSTTFGTNSTKPNISPVAFLVDRCENVYVSGWGGWYAPQQDPYDLAGTVGMPVTPDALKSTSDNRDFYFIVIEKNANALLYGSFFGQDGGLGEHVDGGTSRFDQQGAIYQAICANCGGSNGGQLPITKAYLTTSGAYATRNGALPNGCNLGALKIAFNFAGVASGPRSYFNGVVDTLGCVPFTVVFKDTILNAKSYDWNFGDGTGDFTTSAFDITHTFNTVGKFRVRLIAIDSMACNIRDTAYITITVRDDPAYPAFTYTKLPPCQSLSYEFVNTTTFPPTKPFNANSFTWDFGDGTRITPGQQTIQHSYASAGSYKIRLILTDTAYCNAPDSATQNVWVSPLVDARFETPTTGCAPYTAVFNNTSIAGQQFYWDFGDGSTSTETNPIHVYNTVGKYTITLVAVDSNTCNIADTTHMDLNVYPKPTAAFTVSPIPPEVNKPTIFSNGSVGGVKYEWQFGDDETVIKTTLDTVMHQYNATGTFNACLITFNEYGCTDTTCQAVDARVNPLLDVPNAFTPGRFGANSYVLVTGYGIAKMTFKIYNRWGQLVFQTSDRKVGWDGTHNGQPQPMDVYAYTLDVQFSDGKTLRKTGDITLIR